MLLKKETTPLSASITAVLILVFLLVSLGGVVRSAGAGLACPDFPLCYGRVFPSREYHEVLSWLHRVLALISFVLTTGIASVTYRKKPLRRSVFPYFAVAVVFILGQAMFGVAIVYGLLNPLFVTWHLAIGLAILSVLFLAWLRFRDYQLSEQLPSSVDQTSQYFGYRPYFFNAIAVTLVVYICCITGGVVSSHYAGLVCSDFPTCGGNEPFPPLNSIGGIHMFHRYWTIFTTIVVFVFVAKTWRMTVTPTGRALLLTLPVLVFSNIIGGVGLVLLGVPIFISVSHLAGSSLLLLAMIGVC